jgi:quercetin dioxygenase-like cupin family protein
VKIHLQILERVIPSPVARFWRTAARDLLLGLRRFTLFAITIGLAALFSASTQAQEPVPLAHGNVPGEPHHHLKIENEYVRAYYVEVPPHESTQLHQHDHDYIYVSLGPADVVSAVLNEPEVHLQLKDGETHFTRGGFAHVARNLADTPFRNITIELLHPQEGARNVCGPVILNVGFAVCDPIPGSRSGWTEFETADARLDHVWLFSNGKHTETASKLASLVVGLGGSMVKINAKGKSPKTIREGQVEWFDPGSDPEFSCEGCKMAQFLKLTFKDSGLRSNH